LGKAGDGEIRSLGLEAFFEFGDKAPSSFKGKCNAGEAGDNP